MTTAFTVDQLIGFLLVSVRIGTWLWITPPFGGRMVPAMVKVGVSLALALPLTPPAVQAAGTVPTTIGPIVWAVIQQVIIGGALGLASLSLLAAIQSAGSLIDLFGGFSVAQAYDRMLMQQSTVMARVYQMLAAVLMLVTGAYMVLMQGFAATFEVLPLDGTLNLAATATTLTEALTKLFLSALQIAGPLIGISFLADVALGLMTRVAPALNAFSLGFPIKIGLTLILIALAVPMLPPAVIGLSEDAVSAMAGIVGGG
ncbi:MAG: flagellar biosynthetic protein FliR [Candidatus Nanopelagicales bacterium]